MGRAEVLIIMDGGLAGAIACAMECERGTEVVAWLAPAWSGLSSLDPAADAPGAAALVRQQADLYGVHEIIVGSDEREPSKGDASGTLLRAAREATARGCGRIIWPLACGEDIDAMFRVTERADLVGRLATLDSEEGEGGGRVGIETPFVDLSRQQILTLARDLEIADGIWVGQGPTGSAGPIANGASQVA